MCIARVLENLSKVFWFICGLPNSNEGSRRVDSTKSDSNGYFYVELDGKEPVLDFFKENYDFEYAIGGAGIGIMPVEPGSNEENVKIHLDGKAYFNPILVSKHLRLENDSLTIKIYTIKYPKDYISRDTWTGQGPFRYYSVSLDDGINVLGDSYTKYVLDYQVNKTWYRAIDSVYIGINQLYKDTIWY